VEGVLTEPAPILPHNVEVEQALLGAILINNDAFHRVSDFLSPDDFYEPVHQEIFSTVAKLVKVGKGATATTVKTFLPAEFLPEMSMQQYLARLVTEAVTVLNAADFGRLIRDLAVRRKLYSLSQDLGAAALNADADVTPAMQIEEAERGLYEIAERGTASGGFRAFGSSLTEAVQMTAAAYKRDGSLSGLATGLIDLDRLTGGLQRSDLIIIAARPAMGKTAIATNIAFHVADKFIGTASPDGSIAVENGGRVGFFSLEMSGEQLATRILAEQCGIPSALLRRGEIREDQFSIVVGTSERLSRLPLYIDDTGGLTIAQLVSRARRLKRQKGLDLLIVDYLQLLSAPGRRGDGRVQEVTEITTGLKALAKELDIPIVALSQLSRQVEAREDKHPQLSDLRESGSIEQDADVVMFVYREEYYLANAEPKEDAPGRAAWIDAMEKAHGRAELIIGKQRHGPTGTVQLHFDAKLTKFSNLVKDGYLPARTA
jgi:replicative DNA helicase